MARNKYPEQTVTRILDVATELFIEKGYENTTIQDIINNLEGLSKGAIYHHFASKEDIIFAVADRICKALDIHFAEIKKSKDLTGIEKLKKLLLLALQNPSQKEFAVSVPSFLENPKFLVLQLKNTIEQIAPKFIEPFVREGMEDGSIKTQFPKEFAETFILLLNIWMNPFVFQCTNEELIRKYLFFKSMMDAMSIPIFDDEINGALMENINNVKNIK